MKKSICIVLAVIFALSAISCNVKPKNTVKIGIAAPDVTHGWVAGVAYYSEKYCKENNVNYKIITSSDAAEMTASISDLVAWGADAIVVYPQWTGMESTIKEVYDGGTPIVSFDFDIAVDGIYKVTGDNYGMGQKSAEYLASRVPSGSVIAVMDVPSAGSVGALRKQGFYEYLDSIGYSRANVIELQCSGFTREDGIKQMSDVLSAHSQVDAVFSYDDEISIGCIQAIIEAGRTDIKCITGGGGMQEYFRMIADDKYADMGLCSALYSPMMIQDAIKSGIAIANGDEVEATKIISTEIVSRDNVGKYLDPENNVY